MYITKIRLENIRCFPELTVDLESRSAQKRIEGILVDKFVNEDNSWDLDDPKDDPRVSIDNTLAVLGPIQI